MPNISISQGNSKMGSIASVSLPSIVTCRKCDCQQKCYAHKLERLRPSVRQAYQKNLDQFRADPDTYWREVEAAIMMNRYFRFHVSGDIPDAAYLERMISVASRNTHCEILCFTKKFSLVNEYLERNSPLPANLHMIFSAWPGLAMDNPHHLPEAHVRFRDGSTTALPSAKHCSGNCTECAITNDGCWTLLCGEQVIFDEH